jgi:hypothetical protein
MELFVHLLNLVDMELKLIYVISASPDRIALEIISRKYWNVSPIGIH